MPLHLKIRQGTPPREDMRRATFWQIDYMKTETMLILLVQEQLLRRQSLPKMLAVTDTTESSP
jgi:hypothetical protein